MAAIPIKVTTVIDLAKKKEENNEENSEHAIIRIFIAN